MTATGGAAFASLAAIGCLKRAGGISDDVLEVEIVPDDYAVASGTIFTFTASELTRQACYHKSRSRTCSSSH